MADTRRDQLAAAIRSPKRGKVAVMPYLTSGYPTLEGFADLVKRISVNADAIEIGVPFSDPMADGLTIQESSHVALQNGVSLKWILDTLKGVDAECPLVLMSYLNPLMQYGFEQLVADAKDAGVYGFIVPDLPYEECDILREPAEAAGLGLIQLVTPVTPEERLSMLCDVSGGFVYAVTVTGVTGTTADPEQLRTYLAKVKDRSPYPVCAGFGIRNAADVAALAGHADGAVIGSALIKALGAGQDGAAFVDALV